MSKVQRARPAFLNPGDAEYIRRHLLHGELMIEDRKLYPGAYNPGEPGESDQFVWSRDRLQLARTRWLLDHRKWL
jgi:hypothetical protein